MRRLGAWRHVATVRHGTGTAIAQRKNALVAGGLQGLAHLQLVAATGLQARYTRQHIGRLDTRRPHHQVGLDQLAFTGAQAPGLGRRNPGIHPHLHPETGQFVTRLGGYALRQGRQDGGPRLYQGDPHVFGPDIGQSVVREPFRRVVQFRRQFHAGSPGAHDGDAQQLIVVGARIEPQEAVEHTLVELLGVLRVVEEDTVFSDPGGAEVVGNRTQGQHQVIVVQPPFRQHLAAVVVQQGRQLKLPLLAFDIAERTEVKIEAVQAGVGAVTDFVQSRVQGPGGHLVQQRLPDMNGTAIHQGDGGASLATQFMTQPGRQLQATGAAADDYDIQEHLHQLLAV